MKNAWKKIQKLVPLWNFREFPWEFGECQIPGNFQFPVAMVCRTIIKNAVGKNVQYLRVLTTIVGKIASTVISWYWCAFINRWCYACCWSKSHSTLSQSFLSICSSHQACSGTKEHLVRLNSSSQTFFTCRKSNCSQICRILWIIYSEFTSACFKY